MLSFFSQCLIFACNLLKLHKIKTKLKTQILNEHGTKKIKREHSNTSCQKAITIRSFLIGREGELSPVGNRMSLCLSDHVIIFSIVKWDWPSERNILDTVKNMKVINIV